MTLGQDVERALLQALACRDDRKRAETALEALRRKESEAIEHLHDLVRHRPSAPNEST